MYELHNVTQPFSFSAIQIDMDYTGFVGGSICSLDISLTQGMTQGASSGADSYTQILTYNVPEPSTYAAALGVCGLAAGFWRKRRR